MERDSLTSKSPLFPDRHQQLSLFFCDILDAAPKDDIGSMEHPIFTLSTKPDTRIRRYEHNGNVLEIVPSALGAATIFDKDVLIYCISQLVEGLNRGRKDLSRKVRLTAYDFLVSTNRETGGRDYHLLEMALKRLSGTKIFTNIKSGGKRIKEGFGIIDSYTIVERSPLNSQMVAIDVTLSEWLYSAIVAKDVLSLDRKYFQLRKPIDRRVYEIARKHCGKQHEWKIGLALLHKKSGSSGTLREFRRKLKATIESNHLPGYTIAYTEETDIVTFTSRTRDLASDFESTLQRLLS